MKARGFDGNKATWLLIFLFVGIYLLPLGVRPLSVPDEMRYGEIAREMIASGDWVVPHLDGLRYFEKPILGHVLNALSILVFGQNPFGVRAASALATGLSALAIYWLVRREKGARPAFVAAFVFLTTAEVMGVGTLAVLDSMLACFLTLSFCTFFAGWRSRERRLRLAWSAAAGVFAGLAFLVKGFIAFAVPAVAIAPFLIWQGEGKRLLRWAWVPMLTAFLTALPWSIAIALREPDFWRYFFWQEHIHRYFSGAHAQHAHPFWYFLPIFAAGAMPWILLTAPLLRPLLRERKGDPLVRFAVCWLVFPFLFFSLSSGKLGTYILPCFAPFAVLTALGWAFRLEKKGEEEKSEEAAKPLQAALGIFLGLVLLALVALLVFGGLVSLGVLPPLDDRFFRKFLLALFGAGVSVTILTVSLWSARASRKLSGIGLTAAVLFVTVTLALPVRISTSIGLHRFLEKHRRQVEPASLLVGDPKTLHAACFLFRRDDILLFRRKGELAYGLSYPDARERFLDMNRLRELIHSRGDRRLVLLLKSAPGDPRRSQLPAPDRQTQWKNIWLAVYDAPHSRAKERFCRNGLSSERSFPGTKEAEFDSDVLSE